MQTRLVLLGVVVVVLLVSHAVMSNVYSETNVPDNLQAPSKAYLDLYKVVQQIMVTGNASADLLKRDDVQAMMKEVRSGQTFYLDPVITGGKLNGNQALLEVTAYDSKRQRFDGVITMVQGEKEWKYNGSQWTLKVAMPPAARTMEDMRAFGSAILSYTMETDAYPTASNLAAVAKLLEPQYIRKLPLQDQWKHDFNYIYDSEKDQFWLVSYGSDGKPDKGLYNAKGIPIAKACQGPESDCLQNGLNKVETQSDSADIILGPNDVVFLQFPRDWDAYQKQ